MLAAGLRALGEADDFVMIDAEQQLNIDMAGIVAMHESRIITEAEASMLTPIAAMQKYFQYATEQISAAAGNSVVAADALYAMGKLLQTSSSEDPAGKPIDRAKAMVMFQAALAANAEDYRSANELGVLMAHNGRWEMARDLFAQSLKIHKTAEAWLNIAEAHEQLGESGYAEQARVEYRQLVTAGHPDSNVEWVSAQQFASKGVLPVEPEAVEVPRTAAKPEDSVRPKGNRLLEGIKKWF
jgi:tetratricopeptide (TPR) repeat protein